MDWDIICIWDALGLKNSSNYRIYFQLYPPHLLWGRIVSADPARNRIGLSSGKAAEKWKEQEPMCEGGSLSSVRRDGKYHVAPKIRPWI